MKYPLTAVVSLVAAVAVGSVAAIALRHRHHAAPPPPPPPPKPFRIVFPEGFTREQMITRVGVVVKIADRERHTKVLLSAHAYRIATRRAVVPCVGKRARTNLEGFLFPATYDFLKQTTARQLVTDQIVAFCRNWLSVSHAYAHSKNLTAYDVVKIASMIEREALAPGDRALIAAVIYNRLHAGMPLGIDATLRYGLHIPANEPIHQSQLASDTPYNSRKSYGLPPTPIANPGLASIRAAAHPAQVDYLYYARKPDKIHHFFTASGTAFNQYLATHGYG